jgi:hypothetical protein
MLAAQQLHKTDDVSSIFNFSNKKKTSNTLTLLCNYCIKIMQITYFHLLDRSVDGQAALLKHPIYLGN